MQGNILVLEASTTSAKAMVYHPQTGILSVKSMPYGKKIGGLTQDAPEVFRLMIQMGREAAEGQEIAAVSLGCTWHNLLLCDQNMQPVMRALTWQYTEAAKTAQQIRADAALAQELYERTGCMVHALYPAYKLLHLKKHGVDLRGKRICSQGSWNFYRLTGKRWVTASLLAGSAFLNIRSKEIDERVLKMVGAERDALGEIVDLHSTAPLLPEMAAQLCVTPGIPVIPTHPDGALNQVGALREGVMTLSIGTSAALRYSQGEAHTPYGSGLWCYLSPVSWLLGAATSGACNCVDWAKDAFFGRGKSYQELENAAVEREKLPIFLPFNFGERCPGWRDDALGGFFGLNSAHTAVDFYHSVREGVLFNIRQCYEHLVRTTGIPRKIIISGGILNSASWLQMLADILQAPLCPDKGEQASLLGGAVLGRCVLSGEDVTAYETECLQPILPGDGALYEERYQRYLRYYDESHRSL